MTALPRVTLVPIGGTIESAPPDRLQLAGYVELGILLEPGQLAAGVAPELARFAEVEEVPFRRLGAHAITDGDLANVVDVIRDRFARGTADGVVVTHGTNTLEETAWLLHLVIAGDRPVVVAGAMRPSTTLGADGQLNLVGAVRLAASEEARGLGALVFLDDTIHAARTATKSDTMRVAAFKDGPAGPLGWVDGDGRIVLAARPARGGQLRGAFADVDLRALPRVDIVVTYQGADGSLIEAAVAAGARGIVSAGTGAGYPTPREQEALEAAAAAGVTVVQSTRVGGGRVPPVPKVRERGWIAAGDLNPWKARILLRLALARGDRDAVALQALFDD